MGAGWRFGALCWSSGKDLMMNKRRGDTRLYSPYVWSCYWNGVEFVYFIGFCDDMESVLGDVYCRMSSSKPCSVSVEHSAVTKGYFFFGVMSPRWSNGGTFCPCMLCHRWWASFKCRAFCFCVTCLSSVWKRLQFAEAMRGVLPIFLVYLGENVYYSLHVNNAHLGTLHPTTLHPTTLRPTTLHPTTLKLNEYRRICCIVSANISV